jgi:hypothetical protein
LRELSTIGLAGLPDIPFTKAVLTLPGGSRGIFANSESPLCTQPRRVQSALTAHSGKQRRFNLLRLRGDC